MSTIEKLQKVIAASTTHQKRLQATKNEEEAISALLEVAGAEGISLTRADLEQKIAAEQQQVSEISDEELASVSGGGQPFWYRFQSPRADW